MPCILWINSSFYTTSYPEIQVSTNEFLEVLAQYGLRMEKPHMGDFLARCELQASSLGIPYQEFLVKFQDRSEGGMAHHILTNPKHRFAGFMLLIFSL